MTELPNLSGRETVRGFESLRWQVVRQKGSHIILTKPGKMATLSVPDHKEIARRIIVHLLESNSTVRRFYTGTRMHMDFLRCFGFFRFHPHNPYHPCSKETASKKSP